jgi:DNA-binding NarL/FixJ family response regulator
MEPRMSEGRRIRVLVVDDHAILREGICSLLERQDDMQVVGEAANGEEALARVADAQPDLVLMDLAMPGMGGLEATRRLHATQPEVRVLVLTQHDNREFVTPALEAGAAGYVLKRSGGREVVNAIRQVMRGATILDSDLAQKLGQRPAGQNPREAHLTERELQVLGLVVDGLSNKEIALQLNISPKTASVHRSNIMQKLGARNTADLVRTAMQRRLLGETGATLARTRSDDYPS